jgi:hypothetical protein
MKQDKKPANPSQQNTDPPGNQGKKNAGHTNPAHNTPGQTRQDQPGQQDPGQPGQGETQSYPGIKGPKARDLQQDSTTDKGQAKGSAAKKVNAAHRGAANTGGSMTERTNEPPEPNTPGPEPDDVPQPEQDEVELPPREDKSPVKAGRRPGFRT